MELLQNVLLTPENDYGRIRRSQSDGNSKILRFAVAFDPKTTIKDFYNDKGKAEKKIFIQGHVSFMFDLRMSDGTLLKADKNIMVTNKKKIVDGVEMEENQVCIEMKREDFEKIQGNYTIQLSTRKQAASSPKGNSKSTGKQSGTNDPGKPVQILGVQSIKVIRSADPTSFEEDAMNLKTLSLNSIEDLQKKSNEMMKRLGMNKSHDTGGLTEEDFMRLNDHVEKTVMTLAKGKWLYQKPGDKAVDHKKKKKSSREEEEEEQTDDEEREEDSDEEEENDKKKKKSSTKKGKGKAKKKNQRHSKESQ